MYESFFGLNKKPFQITTDPSFLWMGKKHREALSTLKYGVMDNKGFLLLTGDVGTRAGWDATGPAAGTAATVVAG